MTGASLPDGTDFSDDVIREKTIEASLQTREKLLELMDQIDETVIALRAEIQHAKMRRGEL